ncbi:MAG: 50S ribosomal protein L6 [Proteobacteria bacterium]|nr:50S ribosomal protein L6 [Pseudomonadota bacterium]
MSRIGKKPIEVPDNVKIRQDNSIMEVTGPKGTLSMDVPGGIEVILDNGSIIVKRRSDDRKERSLHGLVRTLIANMVTGVTSGFEKTLEITGVGYRAEVKGNTLSLLLGFSHPVEYKIPDGISIKVDKQVIVAIFGIDKDLVGRVAAEIRSFKKPEPYKGKGIKYSGEYIRRKVGKSAGV